MKIRLTIWMVTLLLGCTREIPENLADRFRIPENSYEQLNQDNVLWLRQQIVGVDSLILYDFFRFSSQGRVFYSSGIPLDSLELRYNDFSKGSIGRFMLNHQSLQMEIWRGRYDKFLAYQGYFQDDQLVITSMQPRGFFKAGKKKIELRYSKTESSNLQPIPEL